MSRKRYSPEKIIGMLREAEISLARGVTVGQISRQLSISEQTYYRWRKQYGGMKISRAKRMKDMERENSRLKKAVAGMDTGGLQLFCVVPDGESTLNGLSASGVRRG